MLFCDSEETLSQTEGPWKATLKQKCAGSIEPPKVRQARFHTSVRNGRAGFKGRESCGSQRGHGSQESCRCLQDGGREGQGCPEVCPSAQAAGDLHLLAWLLGGPGMNSASLSPREAAGACRCRWDRTVQKPLCGVGAGCCLRPGISWQTMIPARCVSPQASELLFLLLSHFLVALCRAPRLLGVTPARGRKAKPLSK